MPKKLLLFFLILIFATLPAESNEMDFEFMVDVGSQTGVLMQDLDGFIWIGTQDGAVKYDGYKIKRYSTENSRLSNNMVMEIYQDKEGLIWIGTKDGLNVYDKKTDSFKVYRHDRNNQQSISSSSLASNYGESYIIEDSEGYIWIGTDNGLNRFDKKNNLFKVFKSAAGIPGTLSDNSVSSVLEDSKGNIWVGTDSGLNQFDNKTGLFRVYNKSNSLLANNAISSIIEDTDGYIWVATKGGISRFNRFSNTFLSYHHDPADPNSLPFKKVDRLFDNGDGRIWLSAFVGKEKGLAIFDKKTGIFSAYYSNTNTNFNLSGNSICDIYQDNAGTIWLPSFSGPVDIYHSEGHPFTRYIHNPNNPNTILPDVITTVHEDPEGLIWFASVTGITSYNRETQKFSNTNKGYVTAGIASGSDGFIWFSGSSQLFKYDKQKQEIVKTYQMAPSSYANSLVEDLNNPQLVWMGTTSHGLVLFNKNTEMFSYFKHDPDDKHSIANNAIVVVLQDKQGNIWAPTLGGGLDVFDPKMGKVVTNYRHDPEDPTSLSSNSINHLIKTRDGSFWIATSNGLNRFESGKGTFRVFSKKTGFPANNIMTMLEDNDGILWVGSKVGLIKFNPKTEESRLYTESDGLPSNELWEYQSLKAKDGSLWFGTPKGAFSFDPQEIRENSFIPPVFITALKQGGKEIKTGTALENLREINLDWRDNFFEFEYVALNYLHSEKNQFMYQLKGFDKGWYQAGSQKFGRYSGLPGGRFTLMIKAANNDSIWNEKGISIKVNVAVPWWKTRLFLVVAICSVLLVLATIFLLRDRAIKRINLQLEKRVKEKTHELQEAFDNIKTLKGLVPICAKCKKIRDDQGYWNHLESYIEKHSDAQFSHGICNDCASELYGDSKWYKKRKDEGKI